jgi:hypothetical protein
MNLNGIYIVASGTVFGQKLYIALKFKTRTRDGREAGHATYLLDED